ncbi:MAG: electron transfer flavoprotein subunit alpha/FixB family protein [Thermoplasmatota archaeon]
MAYDPNDSSGVWILAEHEKGEIHPITYELLRKARELSDDIDAYLTAVLCTPDKNNSQELIYRGADRVIVVEDDRFDEPDESFFKDNIVRLVKEEKPHILLVGATNFGRSLAPRIAAALKTGLTADCTGLKIDDGNFVQIRPAFTGNILAHISTDRCPKMSTVRYKEFDESERNENRDGEIVEKEPIKSDNDEGIEILEEIVEEKVNIQDAEIVCSGGRGLKDSSDFELIEALADTLGGKVGSSRPLVDEGWISRDHQVGYSGNRVKPRIYIACGISGAPQHLAGMKESDIIIAINKDASAPIFQHADYGIVGDLYEVIPEMIEQIKEK